MNSDVQTEVRVAIPLVRVEMEKKKKAWGSLA